MLHVFHAMCGRNESFLRLVHPFLDTMLIRQGWEASFPDVGLNKFVRVESALCPFPKRTIPDWGQIRPSYKKAPFCVLHMIGTPFLRLNAYKTKVEGVYPRYGIEKIREGDIGP